jgi:hypothetical protein
VGQLLKMHAHLEQFKVTLNLLELRLNKTKITVAQCQNIHTQKGIRCRPQFTWLSELFCGEGG